MALRWATGVNGGRPGAALRGWGGRGIWGKGRVSFSASYFNSLPLSLPSPPGPRLLFCPGASPTHRPRRPPSPHPPAPPRVPPSPARRGAPRILPPSLLPSRIVWLGLSNGGQEAAVLLADCRGANPRPGATAAGACGGPRRSPGAQAPPLRALRPPPGRRFRAA